MQLHDLREIYEMWGKDAKTVYRAVRFGRLHAYGRPGRQKYYSEAELKRVFGPPVNGSGGPARMERPDKGGYQQRFELDASRAA